MVQSWIQLCSYLVKCWWRSTLALRSTVRDWSQEDSQSRCCSPLCSVLFLCLAPSLVRPASVVLSSLGLVDLPPLLSLSKLNWRPSGCCWYDGSLAAAKEIMCYSRSLSLINYAIALDWIFWLNDYLVISLTCLRKCCLDPPFMRLGGLPRLPMGLWGQRPTFSDLNRLRRFLQLTLNLLGVRDEQDCVCCSIQFYEHKLAKFCLGRTVSLHQIGLAKMQLS